MRSKSLFIIIMIMILNGCNGNKHEQFEGYVEGENIFLASPFYGVLNHLAVQRGQQVKKGELLYSLDPNPQLMNIIQIQGELAQAKSQLNDLKKPRRREEIDAIEAQIQQTNAQITLADIRVSRYQKLVDKQASDKDSLDAALAYLQQQKELKMQYEANLALAKLGSREDLITAQQGVVDSLIAKLNISQWELAQKTIYAPADGVIFDTYYRTGEYVAAQQSVLSLLTPENIRIEFFVPLEFLAQLKVGQNISFDCEGCQKNNPAVISYISPDAEYLPPLVYSRDNSSKLVFRIKARINNPSLFKPGQPVMVNL
ncbi:HlyD family secretion protein [Legionella bononiensis]|uniref:HlyD family efflux transporter periplasmic adaptor subunit n=2 Tax=Legionella bononiensis TaxID=2793102 RepID=A0ABS1W6F5_9GAMM|nr:HlyD family efflux transporter periplasmic adaptor subunit [Legionella bononiensis]MBL7478354.1 HlyD family efflux transporter periplasmic adaptor subunit [Legionella bononiensis]MBL7524951.1 HlyD family efflux transporter periplasmic adaptor subunit [Legionella bononiensis]MBL7561248.1 HlyD family efflux transporter periplasmic adaptor subunit [Legionella bononiensis]